MPVHLRPSAPIAADALLPGDPGRALSLSQMLMVQPKMSNHHRGLWGYWGETAKGGRPLTIQSTGMGGPSAAIVLTELAELGVRRAIRVGTCGAVAPRLELGSLLRVEGALAGDGTSRGLGATGRVTPDPELTAEIASADPETVAATVATTDLFYEPEGGHARRRLSDWAERGAGAVEMEAASLFTLGPRLGVAVGCLLVVSDVFEDGERVRIESEQLEAAVERMGGVAAAALAGERFEGAPAALSPR